MTDKKPMATAIGLIDSAPMHISILTAEPQQLQYSLLIAKA